MPRWHFDGFSKLEQYIEVNLDKFRTRLLPRLSAVESEIIRAGDEQRKKRFEDDMNTAIDELAANDAWSGGATREGKILRKLEECIAPFEAVPPEQLPMGVYDDQRDEAVARCLRESRSAALLRQESPPGKIDIHREILYNVTQYLLDALLTFWVRKLGSREWTKISDYPAKLTLADLADRLSTEYHGIPEFWIQKKDKQKNCVTESGIYWEWQNPTTRVVEATVSGIETVTMPGDYVVVVLQKDGKESGMPIGLVSDLPRRSAINHLQQVFQGHRVERVQWLENKGDASNAYFDKITFCFKMTALFVEVLPVSAEATA